MTRYLRDFRLIPIVLFATIALFALKTIGLLIDGHYTLDAADDAAEVTGSITAPGAARSPLPPTGKQADKQPDKQTDKQSWAQQMLGYPDITGSAGTAKPAEKKDAAPAKATPEEPPKGKSGWTPVPTERGRPQSPAEIAILE